MSANATQPLNAPALSNESLRAVATSTNDSPYPTIETDPWNCVSPLIQTFQEGTQVTDLESTPDLAPASGNDVIPVEQKDSFKLRDLMRMIQCRTYLLRCEVLQSTIDAIERKPWEQRSEAVVRRYYSKMRKLAIEARKLAAAVSSRDLQARSQYWSGRGCGGLRDWEAAVRHFTDAVMLDVSEEGLKNVSRRQRGLFPVEREDVEFLLQSVTQHYNEWIEKKGADKALRGRKTSPRPFEDVQKEALKGSCWRPHQDRMVHLAKQQSDTENHCDRLLTQLGLSGKAGTGFSKEDMAAVDERLRLDDGRQEIRQAFDAEDWWYVLRGDQTTKKRMDSTKHRAALERITLPTHGERQHSKLSRVSSSSSVDPTKHTSSGISRDLSNALVTAGYDSSRATPSLSGSGKSPSSEGENESPFPSGADLQGRRAVKLGHISTSAIQKNPRPGQAVLGSIPTNLGMDED